jgi:hypothetical protein
MAHSKLDPYQPGCFPTCLLLSTDLSLPRIFWPWGSPPHSCVDFSSSPLLPVLVPIFSFSGVISWLGVSVLAFLLRPALSTGYGFFSFSNSLYVSPLFTAWAPRRAVTRVILSFTQTSGQHWLQAIQRFSTYFLFWFFWRGLCIAMGEIPGSCFKRNLYSYSIVCYFFHTDNSRILNLQTYFGAFSFR